MIASVPAFDYGRRRGCSCPPIRVRTSGVEVPPLLRSEIWSLHRPDTSALLYFNSICLHHYRCTTPSPASAALVFSVSLACVNNFNMSPAIDPWISHRAFFLLTWLSVPAALRLPEALQAKLKAVDI